MAELQVLDLTCMFGRRHGYKQSLENRYKVLNSLLATMISHFKPEDLGNYIEQILNLIRRLKQDPSKVILLVEHKMDVVRELADRIIVLHNGCLVADGPPAEVMASDVVREAYLGTTARSPGAAA